MLLFPFWFPFAQRHEAVPQKVCTSAACLRTLEWDPGDQARRAGKGKSMPRRGQGCRGQTLKLHGRPWHLPTQGTRGTTQGTAGNPPHTLAMVGANPTMLGTTAARLCTTLSMLGTTLSMLGTTLTMLGTTLTMLGTTPCRAR